ncbi:hypothetical protein AS156_28725 [Bradyrhizobium macuxiense]|uniref:Thioredoxin-like fold domain-containing protein n=1 Tax=Bradyrhizobium macuxiense TaxID=1755647 RepID=A0A109K3Z4_9BRAD|nr:thioredoxin domain-containing protein [Bradyrhizobium macuxiense]KWV60387.1 hypothetical protein AS156_28725 [Bradyrhizobium macuxiense]
MELMIPPSRLDRPVNHETDHELGPADAEITLVEYGSYACPHCKAANECIAQARDQLGDRVCYASRHGLSAVVRTVLFWGASRQELIEEAPRSAGMRVS